MDIRAPTIIERIRHLEPGRSLAFPGEKLESVKMAAHRLRKYEGFKLMCKDTPDGFTVWRIA